MSRHLLKAMKLEPFCVAQGIAVDYVRLAQGDLPYLPLQMVLRKPPSGHTHLHRLL